MDLAVKGRSGEDAEKVRAETAEMMDRRRDTGEPYFFLGLPTVIGGPCDDVVLPAYSDQHDWELELAAVIGAEAYQVTEEAALSQWPGTRSSTT